MVTQTGLSDNLCAKSSKQLGDEQSNPCENSTWTMTTWISNKILGKGYETTVQTIVERANYNMPFGSFCYPLIQGSECYRPGEVGCIINSYTNHASSNEFPSYNPNDSANSKRIIDIVKSDTGRPEDRIKTVLDHLYTGVKDGSISSWQLLDPIGYENKSKNLGIPNNIDSGKRDAAGFLDDIKNYAKWGAITVGAGAVIYFGVQAFGLIKTVKGAA